MTDRTRPETPVGQPLGDTGDGDTGVPEFEQGMSNRPGDKAVSDTLDDADEDEDLDSLEDDEDDDSQ